MPRLFHIKRVSHLSATATAKNNILNFFPGEELSNCEQKKSKHVHQSAKLCTRTETHQKCRFAVHLYKPPIPITAFSCLMPFYFDFLHFSPFPHSLETAGKAVAVW